MAQNKYSIKISQKSKDFLNQMRLNRIKLDKSEVNFNEAIELIQRYFKKNNPEYVKMLKEEENVQFG